MFSEPGQAESNECISKMSSNYYYLQTLPFKQEKTVSAPRKLVVCLPLILLGLLEKDGKRMHKFFADAHLIHPFKSNQNTPRDCLLITLGFIPRGKKKTNWMIIYE